MLPYQYPVLIILIFDMLSVHFSKVVKLSNIALKNALCRDSKYLRPLPQKNGHILSEDQYFLTLQLTQNLVQHEL